MPGIDETTQIPYMDYPSESCWMDWLDYAVGGVCLVNLAPKKIPACFRPGIVGSILFIAFVISPITMFCIEGAIKFPASSAYSRNTGRVCHSHRNHFWWQYPGCWLQEWFPVWRLEALPCLAAFGWDSFNTHSLFTPLVFGILGFTFAESIRQPYRTTFFRWLGHPLVASIFLGIINIPLVILTALWGVPGSLAVVIEYSLVQSWPLFITRAVELLVGGILCEIIFLSKSKIWFHPQRTRLSPVENNLQTRYLSRIIPLFIILIFSLTIAGWKWASNTARAQMEKRLQDTAIVVANTIPYFLETGQNLIVRQAANPGLIELSPEELQVEFGKLIHQVVFFENLGLVSGDSNSVTWYGDKTDLKLTKEEIYGVTLAK